VKKEKRPSKARNVIKENSEEEEEEQSEG